MIDHATTASERTPRRRRCCGWGGQQELRRFVAVDDVSLDIARRVLRAARPVGCGKTTLLRMIAGFETPDSRPHPDRRHRHDAGAALRAAGQHDVPVLRAVPASDGRGQVAFGLKQEGIRAPRSPSGSRRCWRWSSSRASARRKPDQLSGGQRQRVALARALVKRPQGAAARRAAGGARQEAARGAPSSS